MQYVMFYDSESHPRITDIDGCPSRAITEGRLYPLLSDGVLLIRFYDDLGKTRSLFEIDYSLYSIIDSRNIEITTR